MVVELVLIRGLPGSGKSTLAKAMQGHHHLEADMIFEDPATGVYDFDPAQLRSAHKWCQTSAHVLLKHGKRVVVSNTFTQKWEMQPYFDMAASLGIPVRVIVAKGEFENVHGVPAEAIERMRKRWED